MAEITYSNEAQPYGHEVYVADLGILKNGESVEFSSEQIAQYEGIHGEGAFNKIPNTSQFNPALVGIVDEGEKEEAIVVDFPTSTEVSEQPDMEGGGE